MTDELTRLVVALLRRRRLAAEIRGDRDRVTFPTQEAGRVELPYLRPARVRRLERGSELTTTEGSDAS